VPPEDVKKLALDAMKLINTSSGKSFENQELISATKRLAANLDKNHPALSGENLFQMMPD
jgi:predicted signal transduction protein with EAL and GGDEF domain